MKHIPEGVIQVPESPDAPEALPGCRSISDDDLCAWCTRLLYRLRIFMKGDHSITSIEIG